MDLETSKDQVDRVMTDLAEGIEFQNELSEFFAKPLEMNLDCDENEVKQELIEIEDEQRSEKIQEGFKTIGKIEIQEEIQTTFWGILLICDLLSIP